MDVFAVDDSLAREPTRPGMGPMVGVGGVHIPSAAIGQLERDLDALCAQTGFPEGDEFKWSPERGSWMWDKLKFKAREDFFLAVLRLAKDADTTAIVVAEDRERGRARQASATPEDDVVTMFLERAHNHLFSIGAEAMLIFDRPGGGGQESERKFLAGCVETMRAGTAFVNFERLTLALASDSKLVRLLQLADLVTGATVQRVAGEPKYSPAIFEAISPLLRRESGRAGGVGLKLHPDFCFVNLYHWLAGDTHFWRGAVGRPLPIPGRAYFESPDLV